MNRYQDLFSKNFLKISTAISIILTFLYILTPFITAFLFAGMLSLALHGFVELLIKKYHWGRTRAINMLILALSLLGVIPGLVFVIRGASIIGHFFTEQSVSVMASNVEAHVFKIFDTISMKTGLDPMLIKDKFNEVVQIVSAFVIKISSDALSQIPDLILVSIVTFFTFYFFLLKALEVKKLYLRFFCFSFENSERFLSVLKSSCREVFFANVLTGILQSLIVAFGAFFCNIGDFYIIFVLTFIISFIPVLGAAPMAFVIAFIGFIEGKFGAGIAMCVIGLISGIADNIIRPYLSSLGEVEVPAFVGFLAVIGGVIVLGLPGLFVGPLIASLVFGVLPLIFDEYFPNHEKEDNGQNPN